MFMFVCVVEGYSRESAHAGFVSRADALKWACENSSDSTRYIVLDENNNRL